MEAFQHEGLYLSLFKALCEMAVNLGLLVH